VLDDARYCQLKFVERFRRKGAKFDSSELPQSVAARQIRIALALVIGGVAAWPRKGKGFLISLVALLWISLEYILWWKESVGALDAAGMSFSHVRIFSRNMVGSARAFGNHHRASMGWKVLKTRLLSITGFNI